ncbi:MAG: GlxA family transcriptional regulator [Pseudomonadota bacterium]
MNEEKPRSFGFLLVPGFSLMAFTAAIEPLRAANQLSGQSLYTWKVYSPDGGTVASKHNIEIVPDSGIDSPADVDYLFVAAGEGAHAVKDTATFQWLRNAAGRNITIGAVSSGPFVLANARLLENYRCTIHWDDMPAFVEAFPELNTSYSLFEIDRNRITSSGGTASMDMMLHLIGDQHSPDLASRVAVFFQHDRMRTPEDKQQLAERLALTRKSPKLAEAVRLMTQNVEFPLKPIQIAQEIGLSLRQLERLCHKYCHCTPQKFYMKIRIQHARSMLLETGMSVMQIAIATGFTTQSHFTKCFRDHYDITPQKLRTTSR